MPHCTHTEARSGEGRCQGYQRDRPETQPLPPGDGAGRQPLGSPPRQEGRAGRRPEETPPCSGDGGSVLCSFSPKCLEPVPWCPSWALALPRSPFLCPSLGSRCRDPEVLVAVATS